MTVEETRAYLRIAGRDEDAVIARLVAAARGVCEAFLGTALIRGEVREALAADGTWRRLRVAPVAAITQVSPAGGHAIDIDANGDGWVRAHGGGRVTVRYVAGLAADEGGVPAAIAQGVVRLAAHLYVHRDQGGEPPVPAAVAALWRPFRRMGLRA